MVLKCEIRDWEGKPQVEQYGLDELAASAEAVVAGLGPLAAGLARLAVEAGRAVTLDAMEVLVIERGRELLRGLVQLGPGCPGGAGGPAAGGDRRGRGAAGPRRARSCPAGGDAAG